MLCLQYAPSSDWSCQCQGHYFIQSKHRMLKIKWRGLLLVQTIIETQISIGYEINNSQWQSFSHHLACGELQDGCAHKQILNVTQIEMVLFYSRTVSRLINKYPGKKFGIYRFIPVFFLFGAGLEFFMIKFTFKEANFCK